MGVGWARPVDRDEILWAGRKDDHQIELRPKSDRVTHMADGLFKAQTSIFSPWNIHEQVERAWGFRDLQPELSESGVKVVGAIVVVFDAAKLAVTKSVTGRHERIVNARRRVAQNGEDRPAVVAEQAVAGLRDEPGEPDPRMLHRHEFAQILGIERPGVDDLMPVGIDHRDVLAGFDQSGYSSSCRNRHPTFVCIGH